MGRKASGKIVACAVVCATTVLALLAPANSAADASGSSIAFKVKASNGYSIFGIGFSRRADGRGTVTLFIGRKGAGAAYAVPATLVSSDVRTPSVIHPPKEIRADLGALGRIELSFVPSGTIEQERSACGKSSYGFEAGTYRGVFEFHGEEGFTEASSSRVKALLRPLLNLVCGGVVSGESGGSDLPGARLRLSGRIGDRKLSLQVNKNRPNASVRYEATLEEHRDDIRISRFVGAEGLPSGAFSFEKGLRAATLSPSAPFSGSATFHRNAKPTARWSGDLTVDFPGESDVPLAGSGIRATLAPAEFQGPMHSHRSR